jgi:hypothetical protein
MTDEQFISGFLAVFETKPEVFEQAGAVDKLANLSNTISQMADKSNKEVADAIGDWCENYPKITDEINKFDNGKLKTDNKKRFFLTWYAKLTVKMPSKQTSIFVIFKIPKAIGRTFY